MIVFVLSFFSSSGRNLNKDWDEIILNLSIFPFEILNCFFLFPYFAFLKPILMVKGYRICLYIYLNVCLKIYTDIFNNILKQ